MEITKFIAIFTNADAAMHFANSIAKEFSYLVKGNSIHVNGRKISNTNINLFAVDGEQLSVRANKTGNLLRAIY